MTGEKKKREGGMEKRERKEGGGEEGEGRWRGGGTIWLTIFKFSQKSRFQNFHSMMPEPTFLKARLNGLKLNDRPSIVYYCLQRIMVHLALQFQVKRKAGLARLNTR